MNQDPTRSESASDGLALGHGLVIGRSAEADYTVSDPAVSRRHLQGRPGRRGMAQHRSW